MITAETLNEANDHGLKVIAGFWVNPIGSLNCSVSPCMYTLNTYNADSNDPGLNVPFDLTNPYITNDILMRFENYVNTFKNRGEILFWTIGNENNLSLNPNDPVQVKAWYSLADQMAKAAHAIEGADHHPVAVVNGDIQFIGDAAAGADDNNMTDVDIWGANTYRGRSFRDYFIQYKNLSAKPLWISEYGIDAWQSCDTTVPAGCDPNNPAGSEDQLDQALWDGDMWDEIAGNGDITIGATVMEYSDEWWKPYDWICANPPYSNYVNGPANAAECHFIHFNFGEGPGSSLSPNSSSFISPSPDHYANEEWWGLMGISNASPEIQADTMTPREAYTTLQKKFLDFRNNTAIASYLILPFNDGNPLNSATITFTWSLGKGVSRYELLIGTSAGGEDVYFRSGTDTSATVSGIPLTGKPLYVQLASYMNGSWQSKNYIFQTVDMPALYSITASAGAGGKIDPSG
ncbi:MAG TPA: hypothetical protein VNZ86_19890, partial [Bacteroidia bacterium]|nr:hypothetical protein [Bacteroidia bacterium]